MQISATVLSILSAIAYFLLTLAGALLWKRSRSLSSAMIAIGFAIILIDQAILLVGYLRMNASFSHQPGDTLFIIYHRANSLHIVLIGLWLSGLGLIWHAAGTSRR
jgi:hypothetical protein